MMTLFPVSFGLLFLAFLWMLFQKRDNPNAGK